MKGKNRSKKLFSIYNNPEIMDIIKKDCEIDLATLPIINPFQNICGIYFLCFDDEVTYIGKSVNIFARINAHITSIDKKFNYFKFFPCKKEYLDIYERLFINRYMPMSNKDSTTLWVIKNKNSQSV